VCNFLLGNGVASAVTDNLMLLSAVSNNIIQLNVAIITATMIIADIQVRYWLCSWTSQTLRWGRLLTPELKLTITLRHLVTADSYRSLMCSSQQYLFSALYVGQSVLDQRHNSPSQSSSGTCGLLPWCTERIPTTFGPCSCRGCSESCTHDKNKASLDEQKWSKFYHP